MTALKNRFSNAAMKWRFKIFLAALGTLAVLTAAMNFDFIQAAPPQKPQLDSTIQNDSLRVGALERTYLYHVPASLRENPALVLVFHGGGIDAEKMREITAYEFERLADENNFILVYPNGFEKSWNGCRKRAPYPANLKKIDDPAFVRALIRRFRNDFNVDSSRVFAMGFSNGGHLVYRLALEMPNEILAIAALGANLPVKEDCDCSYSNRSIAVMIINGNQDRVNPYEGGVVTVPSGDTLGTVHSATATAEYFRRLAGHQEEPMLNRYPDGDGNAETWVERLTWEGDVLPEVSLLTVNGGGHTIPQPKFRFPKIYGATNADVNSLEEIWRFFERQMQKRRAVHN